MNSKYEGLILGSIVGDALGVPVEFFPRQVLQREPVIGMREFGSHNQPRGTWSDDSSLILCSLETLINKEPPIEALKRFVKWVNEGYWTARGDAFDIGNTTADALAAFIKCGIAKAPNIPESNGNGALMRIAPLIIFVDRIHTFPEKVYDLCKEWSTLTHGHEISAFACFFYSIMIGMILEGKTTSDEAYRFTQVMTKKFAPKEFDRLVNSNISVVAENEIKSSGYVVHTLEAAIWCALNSKSYSEGVLKAINLGEDTDTTGCVCGGILGAYHGVEAIPSEWLNDLARLDDIKTLISRIP